MIIDSILNLYNEPLEYKLSLLKSDGTALFIIPEAYDKNFTCSLKELNTFEFKIPYYLEDTKIKNEHFDKFYTSYIIHMKLQSPETGTYFKEEKFKITNIQNLSSEDGVYAKQISCKEMATELSGKTLRSFTGSKVLYRTPSEILSFTPNANYPTLSDFINSGILNVVISLAPSFSVGTVDALLASTYRYFDIDKSPVLDFLYNDCANAFLCIFDIDSVTKTINVKALDNLGTFRGFMLSDSNYIKSHTEEIDDELVCTRLFIYGKDGISCRAASVTGEEYILDLSYYRNTKYMSQELLSSLSNYDDLLATKEGVFTTLLSSLNSYTSSLSTKQVELAILKAELSALEITRDELIEKGSSLASINAQITTKENQITTKNSEITTLNNNITNVTNDIEDLQTEILIENNFSSTEIEELDQFLKDKEIVDQSLLTSQEVYDEGVKIISTLNQPTINIGVDIIDLYSICETSIDWDKLFLGDIIAIKHEAFKTDIQLRLLSFSHNPDTNSLKVNFANKQNINNPSMLAEQIRSSISTTTSLDINKYKNVTSDSSSYSALQSYITDVLNLSNQGAVAGANQMITINEHGITLTNPANPLEQTRILNTGIFITKDGWATSDIALTSNYGINAEIIQGFLGAFATLYANQIIMNGELGMDQVSIKMTHSASGDYTELKPSGLLRYIANPQYTETSLSPNIEDFTTHNAIALLEANGWQFSGTASIVSNDLQLTRGVVAIAYKEITKNNASFSITYRTNTTTAYGTLYIDNITSVALSASTTNATINLTLNKGLHSFKFVSKGTVSTDALIIDSVTFEQNPVQYAESGTYDIVGRSYQYRTYVGTGSSGKVYDGAVPDVYIQLPDDFKGKDFTVSVFLQDTGDDYLSSMSRYAMQTLQIKVVDGYTGYEDDYANAIIRVRAALRVVAYDVDGIHGNYDAYLTNLDENVYTLTSGCDFMYIAQY